MADRDKYGNYVNDKGVTIKINTDKLSENGEIKDLVLED